MPIYLNMKNKYFFSRLKYFKGGKKNEKEI